MKKIICSALLLVILLASLSVAAFAETEEREFYTDLTIGYNTRRPTLSAGPVWMVYAPIAEGSSTTYAQTQIELQGAISGRVSTQINGVYGDIQVGSSTTIISNKITYTATCQDDSDYAVKINHYANRRWSDNGLVDMYDYWYHNGG